MKLRVADGLTATTRAEVLELLGHAELRGCLWSWQFHGERSFAPVVLLDAEGHVAGYNGVMPVRVRFDGRERTAAWSCDYHVAAALRGTGVGRRVKEVLHERHPFLLTFGVSDAAARVLPRLGWRFSPCVGVYRRSLDRAGLRGTARALASWATARRHGGPPSLRELAPEHAVVEHARLPDDEALDALWNRVGGSWGRIVVRDARYLRWRYERFPLNGYRFLSLEQQGTLRALAVFRLEDDRSRLVDLVVHREDDAARALLLRAWLERAASARHLHVATSDPRLGRMLRSEGFLSTHQEARFFVRAPDVDEEAERDWFLMGGDSDGEFLQTGRERMEDARSPGPTVAPARTRFSVRVASPEETLGDRGGWNRLLASSRADPLFLGWAWQSAWWDTWSGALALEPRFVEVREHDQRIALLPLYRRSVRRFGREWLALQAVGNAALVAPTVRTEYLDLITPPARRSEVEDAIASFLVERLHWDLLTINDHVGGTLLPQLDVVRGIERFLERPDEGVLVDTSGAFDAWLAGLGRGSRLRIYNRRTQLRRKGSVVLRQEADPEAVLRLLNEFHLPRWGKPCFDGRSLEFHRTFLRRLEPDGHLCASVLVVEGVPRSVLYDVRIGDRVYNLQAGFDQGFDRKLSLGMLHLGFAIEAAFRDPAVRRYDLLAGGGRSAYYKRSFGGRRVQFRSENVVRSMPLRQALRLRRLRRRVEGEAV